MSKHSTRSGDDPALLGRFAQLREKAQARTGQRFPIIVIQEAGLDGFWIDRVLQKEGIESHIVDPASIATKAPPIAYQLTKPITTSHTAISVPPNFPVLCAVFSEFWNGPFTKSGRTVGTWCPAPMFYARGRIRHVGKLVSVRSGTSDSMSTIEAAPVKFDHPVEARSPLFG